MIYNSLISQETAVSRNNIMPHSLKLYRTEFCINSKHNEKEEDKTRGMII